MNKVGNAIASQLVWLIAVRGAARGFGWAGPVAIVVFALLQVHSNTAIRRDMWAIASCVVLGFACDSTFAATGLVRYASPGPWPNLAPMWIVALWASFGLTLHHSLSFLQARLWLAVALGALFGPLSYYAAADAWQAVELAQPPVATLAVIALAWAIAMPLLLLIAREHSMSRPQVQSQELSP